MAKPVDPKVPKTFSRVLQGVHETFCEKLDLKRVGEKLTTGTRLSKTLRQHIKYAVKNKDVQYFFSVLEQRFNLKSLVFFLEVLDTTVTENHNHKEILSILCHNLGELPLEKEPSEIVAQLEWIRAKYVDKQPSTVVLYHAYPVEIFPFNKSASHLYSQTHDVTVLVEPKAFPVLLDKFDVHLTVNDYSQPKPIIVPPQYTGVYSALINLKCEPHFDKFQEHVTVTLPHCATGDMDSLCDCLCVLSAADGEGELVEDPEIEIDSIDENYITFRTIHFSNSLVSASRKRKQKYRDVRRLQTRLRATLSLDESTSHSSVETSRPRSHSSPAVLKRDIVSKFCAKMCRPRDTSSSSHWQFVFIVTTDKITLTKEVKNHAVALLDLQDVTELALTEARFTFTSAGYIEFCPNLSNKNGWTISSEVKPAEIVMDHVEQYWRLSRHQRKSVDPPYIRYTTTKEEHTGHPLEHTTFSISLSGSQSLGTRETITIEVPCHLKPHPPLPEPNSTRIICDMYKTSSGYSPIIQGLLGELDCSEILLRIDDACCCTLLCEISFHLYRWKELGRHLGMTKQDVDVVILNNECSIYFHEPAFQLLATWLQQSTQTPTLEGLINGLQCIGSSLQLSTWITSHNNITRSLNDVMPLFLAQRIQRHWKFIARLVGESETNINTVVQHEVGHTILDQASYMIEQLKKRIVDGPPLTSELHQTALTSFKVFNSLHCVSEHINDQCLQNALTLFM